MTTYLCQNCGNEFERKLRPGPKPKWCSNACSNYAYRRRNGLVKEWRKSTRATYVPTPDEIEWTLDRIPSRFGTWREALAWAAGFFDGEGTVGIGRDRRKDPDRPFRTIRLMLAQVDARPLIQFQAIVGIGGRVAIHTDASSRHAPCHRLQIQTFEYVQAIVAMMWNFLSPQKRDQYKICAKEMAEYFQEDRVWKGRLMDNTCVFCGKPAAARRLCNTHYHHWWLEQGNNRESYNAKRREEKQVQP